MVDKAVIDAILGEAGGGTYKDMLGVAAGIFNRSQQYNVAPDRVLSQSQVNGLTPAPGSESRRALAERAWNETVTYGPIFDDATYWATPRATGGLPSGLQRVGTTEGHVFFRDPQNRPVKTLDGVKQYQPVVQVGLQEEGLPPARVPQSAISPVTGKVTNPVFDESSMNRSLVRDTAQSNINQTQAAFMQAMDSFTAMTGKLAPGVIDALGKETSNRGKPSSSEYNPGSEHFAGRALDIDTRGFSDTEKQALVGSLFSAGFRGFGFGPNSIHADRGVNVNTGSGRKNTAAIWGYQQYANTSKWGSTSWAGITMADWAKSLQGRDTAGNRNPEFATLPQAVIDTMNAMENRGIPVPEKATRGAGIQQQLLPPGSKPIYDPNQFHYAQQGVKQSSGGGKVGTIAEGIELAPRAIDRLDPSTASAVGRGNVQQPTIEGVGTGRVPERIGITNKGRPAYAGANPGEFYSEKTVTIQTPEGWVAFPSVDKYGRQMDQAAIEDYVAKNGPIDPVTGERFPTFPTQKAADRYAESRSKSITLDTKANAAQRAVADLASKLKEENVPTRAIDRAIKSYAREALATLGVAAGPARGQVLAAVTRTPDTSVARAAAGVAHPITARGTVETQSGRTATGEESTIVTDRPGVDALRPNSGIPSPRYEALPGIDDRDMSGRHTGIAVPTERPSPPSRPVSETPPAALMAEVLAGNYGFPSEPNPRTIDDQAVTRSQSYPTPTQAPTSPLENAVGAAKVGRTAIDRTGNVPGVGTTGAAAAAGVGTLANAGVVMAPAAVAGPASGVVTPLDELSALDESTAFAPVPTVVTVQPQPQVVQPARPITPTPRTQPAPATVQQPVAPRGHSVSGQAHNWETTNTQGVTTQSDFRGVPGLQVSDHGLFGSGGIFGDRGGDGGGNNTWLCTVAKERGRLDYNVWWYDRLYGSYLRERWPIVVEGYDFWARPLAAFIRKSGAEVPLWFVERWALAIAHKMQPTIYRRNKLGELMHLFGVPLCAAIGSVLRGCRWLRRQYLGIALARAFRPNSDQSWHQYQE